MWLNCEEEGRCVKCLCVCTHGVLDSDIVSKAWQDLKLCYFLKWSSFSLSAATSK